MTTEDDSHPDALLAAARSVADTFAGVFGEPGDIAARIRLRTRDWLDLTRWLVALEQLARCILFLLALPLAKPRRAEMNKTERTGQGEAKPEAPAEPRAHFRYWRTRHTRPDIILDPNDPSSLDWRWIPQPPHTAAQFHSAAPVARRFAAVLRVLADPARHAKRLASMLPRLTTLDLSEPRQQKHRNPCESAIQRARERLRIAWADYILPPKFLNTS